MTLHIKDAEADRLARELAELTGAPVEEAVVKALRDQRKMGSADRSLNWYIAELRLPFVSGCERSLLNWLEKRDGSEDRRSGD